MVDYRAAHTDLMDNCEQVFDDPVVRRQSGHRDPRVKIRERWQLAARFAALLTCGALLRLSERRSRRFSSRPKSRYLQTCRTFALCTPEGSCEQHGLSEEV